ncbi:MAG: histidine phosphatase family protein [Deltaproteobacteria bacterium]|nr:histidine phosphatase family protein [Deltaproteobacteria bacterium]
MAAPDRTIILARHGETEWNRIGRWQGATDIPLSDVGRAQAVALGERLAGHGIKHACASHLMRARETAEIVAATLSLPMPVMIDPRLRERGYGSFEGLTREECTERHPEAWARYLADRRAVPPDAEPQAEIITRMTAAMQTVATATEGVEPILVVSHGGAIRSFIHAAADVVLPPLGNGAIVRLRYGADGRFVVMPEMV